MRLAPGRTPLPLLIFNQGQSPETIIDTRVRFPISLLYKDWVRKLDILDFPFLQIWLPFICLASARNVIHIEEKFSKTEFKKIFFFYQLVLSTTPAATNCPAGNLYVSSGGIFTPSYTENVLIKVVVQQKDILGVIRMK